MARNIKKNGWTIRRLVLVLETESLYLDITNTQRKKIDIHIKKGKDDE
jgi:hypothetical protein